MKTLLPSENLSPGLQFWFWRPISLWDGLEFRALLCGKSTCVRQRVVPSHPLPPSRRARAAAGVSAFGLCVPRLPQESRLPAAGEDLSAAHRLCHEPRSACSWSLGSSTVPFLEEWDPFLLLVGPAGAGSLTPGLVAGDITCPGHCGGLWAGARVWVWLLRAPCSHSQPCSPSACASCPASYTSPVGVS